MAQFVLVAVTLIGIYYQLRLARSANAFEQMNRIVREWDSERTTRHKLEILLALRDGVNPADVPYGAAGFVADFWEDVGLLVRAGHSDRTLVSESLGHVWRSWWAALAAFTSRSRIERNDPRIGEHHEWLAGVMAEMDQKAGVSIAFDEAYFTSTLDRRIEDAQDVIRVAEELRAVIVRPMSPSVTLAPAPAAPRKRSSVAQ
jgi:hypothetical protein